MNDLMNQPLMRLIGGADVETVVSHDVIGRLMLVCARQPGLVRFVALAPLPRRTEESSSPRALLA